MVVGQTCTITIAVDLASSSTLISVRASYAVSGAVTVAASDTNACTQANVDNCTVTRTTVFTCTVAGSHTFTTKYRSNGSVTLTAAGRSMTVKVH
jgi:hypothetical protein